MNNKHFIYTEQNEQDQNEQDQNEQDDNGEKFYNTR